MIALRPMHPGTPQAQPLEALYERAFPANERRPIGEMQREWGEKLELFAVYEDAAPVGLIFLLNCCGISHIIYFAIMEERRGQGLGARTLEAIRQKKAGMRIIADLEGDTEDEEKRRQRERRVQFYLRNGFAHTGVRYHWRGENYQIVSCGGPVTKEEFWHFWDSV